MKFLRSDPLTNNRGSSRSFGFMLCLPDRAVLLDTAFWVARLSRLCRHSWRLLVQYHWSFLLDSHSLHMWVAVCIDTEGGNIAFGCFNARENVK
jgi:hypothetical protein